MSTDIAFSYTRRDVQQVLADFAQQEPTVSQGLWTSMDDSDPGYLLFKALVYFNDKSSYWTDRQVGEMFMSTARTREAVVRIGKMLGYDPALAKPASCQIKLTYPSFSTGFTIPANSTWRIGNTIFTCLSAISILAGQTTTNITVVEGEAYSQTYSAPGTPWFKVAAPQNIANLQVSVNDVLWESTDSFIQVNSPTTYKIYEDQQLGRVIMFGSNINTYMPTSGSQIAVTGVLTSGFSGNNNVNNLTAAPVSIIRDSFGANQTNSFTGKTITSATGGQDPESTNSIRNNAGAYYSTQGSPSSAEDARAVTAGDYEVIVGRMPGVGDVKVIGGEEVGQYSNVIITVYGSDPYTVSDDFLNGIRTAVKSLNVTGITPIVQAPTAVGLILTGVLGLADNSPEAAAQGITDATTAINGFIVGLGISGRKEDGWLAKSKLSAAVEESNNVTYCYFTMTLRSSAISSAGQIAINVVPAADFSHAILTKADSTVLFQGDASSMIQNGVFIFDQIGMPDQTCTLSYAPNGEQFKFGNDQIAQLISLNLTTEAA